jgi:hypothetical protein
MAVLLLLSVFVAVRMFTDIPLLLQKWPKCHNTLHALDVWEMIVILVGTPEGKNPLGLHTCRLENNIKRKVKGMERNVMNWFKLDQG